MIGRIRRWLRTRAAEKIAHALPSRLAADYGSSEFYPPAQIRTAYEKEDLPSRYHWLALAAFVEEGVYAPLLEATRRPLSYEDARALVLDQVPLNLSKTPVRPPPARHVGGW
jgi:hypothetical protein